MIYSFSDTIEQDIYKDSRVIAILSKFNLMQNIISDRARDSISSPKTVEAFGLDDTLNEFGIQRKTNSKAYISVDFNRFLEVVQNANINGRWYCVVNFTLLNGKQKELLFNYIKSPSKNGLLVINVTDFREYKYINKANAFKQNKYCNVVNASYPKRVEMRDIVKELFLERDRTIDNPASDIFMIRMNNEYDKYEESIDKIVERTKEKHIGIAEIKSAMVGIQFFDMEDFIEELVKPVNTDKITKRKIYKMLEVLEEKYEYTGIVNILKKNILEMIDFRMLINTGVIPIKLDYFFNDIVKQLPQDDYKAKLKDWQFRKKAMLAAQTSLRDWQFMYMILSSVNPMDKSSYAIKLFEVINRQVLTESNLYTSIKFENNYEYAINKLNKTKPE